MTTVLKVGGSVVTEKHDPETVDGANLARAADAVADVEGGLVFVHGAGSFGHHYADAHGASVTDGIHDAGQIREIHDSMKRLNDAVLDALHARDVPALSVHPLSVASRDRDGGLVLPPETVATMVGEGFVPVLHGDMVAQVGEGATVISGDELVVSLAADLGADRVGLCSAVPGVLDGEGEVIPHIRSFDEVAHVLDGSDATDVTGGMAAKVRELLALDAPAFVFDLDDLPAFVAGDSPGTRIE